MSAAIMGTQAGSATCGSYHASLRNSRRIRLEHSCQMDRDSSGAALPHRPSRPHNHGLDPPLNDTVSLYSMNLTPRQQEILDFIAAFRREHRCSPSIPEMQRAFGIKSPNGIASHLAALEAKGAIRRAVRGSRQVELTSDSPLASIPVCGAVPAGPPQNFGQDLGQGQSEGFIEVNLEPLGFKPQRGCYALRVRGDSMRDAAILDGDIVVLQLSPNPKAGQIVAALIDGESTLKRLVNMTGKWYLKAENAAYPELIPRSDLVIQGAVKLVIRQLKG